MEIIFDEHVAGVERSFKTLSVPEQMRVEQWVQKLRAMPSGPTAYDSAMIRTRARGARRVHSLAARALARGSSLSWHPVTAHHFALHRFAQATNIRVYSTTPRARAGSSSPSPPTRRSNRCRRCAC
jgi:hypothetical protein